MVTTRSSSKASVKGDCEEKGEQFRLEILKKAGPAHQRLESSSAVGRSPREPISAGLSEDKTVVNESFPAVRRTIQPTQNNTGIRPCKDFVNTNLRVRNI
ncbi:hypothetical protein JTB14_001114 [Gonioctena quinquepunctata]|nr:hypothetical protein JTB14_001114 [Gonioctena quinquepunctata]